MCRKRRKLMKSIGIKTAILLLMIVHSFIEPASHYVNAEAAFHTAENVTAHIAGKPAAIDPIGEEDSYSAVLYNNQNGLPTSEANDIVETEDGFIWIGSYSGLIRYDGDNFERIDSTTGIANVGCLYADRKDRLWIGTNDSGIGLYEKGQIRKWGEEDGLRALKISKILEDKNGLMYVGTTSGIYLFDEDLNMTSVDDERITDMYVDGISVDADGETIYCISNEGQVFSMRDGKITSFFQSNDNPVKGVVFIVGDPDHPNHVYLGTNDSTLYYCSIADKLSVEREIDISPMYDVINMAKIDDRFWISGRNGIGILENDTFHFLDNLPMNNSIGSIMKDYEGNMWFTSTRQGVMKLVPNMFFNLFERYNIPEQVVNTTCFCGDNLLIGTDTGLIVLGKDGPLSEFPLKEAKTASGDPLEENDLLEVLKDTRIRSIIRDSKNRLWISTWRASGVLCYDNGILTAYREEDGLMSDHVRIVSEAADGTILVANTGGVTLLKDGAVVKSYSTADGITNPEILTVCGAPNGDILLGSDGGGMFVIHDGKVRAIGSREGLTSGIILRIKYDEKRHLFWVITTNSIAYMSEDYEITTIRKFPYSNNFDMYENNNNEMWVLSSNGIYVVPVEELLENREINATHYGLDNGLQGIATANSYSEVTAEGDLYIAGNSCVTKVNMDHPLENIIDLKIVIPYISADNRRIYPSEDGKFHVNSDVDKLTIYSYVFNYTLTNPTVFYKLEGFDADYMRVSRSDLAPVDYTNLAGGNYRFVIRLKDSQGITGKTISATIVKEKGLFEQPWFYVVSVVGLLALLVLCVYLYVRRKTRIMEKRNQEEVMKARLNTELKTAGQIQDSMLPHTFPPDPDQEEYDIYASMTPAREVGGDFYDFFHIDDDHLCLIMADVSGKGIPAAMFMMNSMAVLQSYARLGLTPADILTKTNEVLCAGNQVDLFVTVWVGILDLTTGHVSAANAGHEYPAIMQKGEFSLMKDHHGFVVGGLEGIKYKEYEFTLEPGDALFLYTDGVPEATDAENKMYGTDRLIETLNAHKEDTPKQILEAVHASVNQFVKETEQFDDLTMMCLRFINLRNMEE